MAAKTKGAGSSVFFQLTRRHFVVFFKNKIQVLYTLLVPIIIFVVYIFFLRSMEMMTVENTLLSLETPIKLSDHPELEKYIGTVVDAWMLSGITALSTITVALQTNNVIVDDKQKGVNRDFASAPIPRNMLIASYFLFNFIVTALICFIFEIVCFIYFAAMGEFVYNAVDLLLMVVVLLYMSINSTLMTVFLCSFFKTQASLSSLIAVISTGMGFLIGAYMPLGMLPSWVQNICAFIPGTFGCALFRFSFMDTPLQLLMGYVETSNIVADPSFITQITDTFGYQIHFFGMTVTPEWQAVAVAIYTLIFIALNIFSGRKLTTVLGVGKKRRKKKALAAALAQKAAQSENAEHSENTETSLTENSAQAAQAAPPDEHK